jgi:hypothetical protein
MGKWVSEMQLVTVLVLLWVNVLVQCLATVLAIVLVL